MNDATPPAPTRRTLLASMALMASAATFPARAEKGAPMNVVLLGDALHTAHFSIGSGTKLAMEDAITLHECCERTETVGDALSKFQLMRKPVIEEYQAAAYESMRWFENARAHMNLSPIELAYALMTRSGRVSYEDLKKRDPDFIAAYKERRQKADSSRQ